MSFDNLNGAGAAEGVPAVGHLKAALSPDAAMTPEIVAIFQQIKNLRESDRSLRSIRRNLELDNIPVLDVVQEDESEGATLQEEIVSAPSRNELSQLLDSFLSLKQEKQNLSDRADRLEAKVNQLSGLVERQAEQLAKLSQP